MALFKVFRGAEEELNNVPLHNGYVYFTEDTGNLFVDVGENEGDRLQVNAHYAKALMKKLEDGSVEEIDIDDIYTKKEVDDSSTTVAYNATLLASDWEEDGDEYSYVYINRDFKCGKDGNVPLIITYVNNLEDYNKIDRADATVGTGIVFTAKARPENDIKIIIIDVK